MPRQTCRSGLIAAALLIASYVGTPAPAAPADDATVREITKLVAGTRERLTAGTATELRPLFAFARAEDANSVLPALVTHAAGWKRLRTEAKARWKLDPPVPASYSAIGWHEAPPAIDAKQLAVNGEVAVLTDDLDDPVAHFRRVDGIWRWDATAQFRIESPQEVAGVAGLLAALGRASGVVADRVEKQEGAYDGPEQAMDDVGREACATLLAAHLSDRPGRPEPRPAAGERRLAAGLGRVSALAASPDGKHLATAAVSAAQPVRLWAYPAGTPTRTFRPAGFGLFDARKLAFSPDGKRLAVLGDGYAATEVLHASRAGVPDAPFEQFGSTSGVWVFDVTTGRQVAAMRPDERHLGSNVAFASDNRHVAFGGLVKAYVWHLDEARPAFAGDGSVDAVAFGPEDALVVVGGGVPKLAVLDWRSRRKLQEFALSDRRPDQPLDSAVAAPDGGSALYTTLQGVIRLDLTTGRVVQRYPLPNVQGINRVNAVALSADGRVVLGCSGLFAMDDRDASKPSLLDLLPSDAGRDVCLWDAANGKLLNRYTGHAKTVSGAVFVEDGKRIVSASTDGTLRVWDTSAK